MRPFAKNVTMSSIQGIVKISFCIALLVLAVTLSAAGGSSSGNSTESASYNITIADVINGTANITIDKPTAAVNETVIVTITDIESGKEFVSIDVDGNSGPVSVTEIIAGANYTFQMPAENVTVTVALENIPPVTVTGISINAAPSKVTYTEGDALDLNGLVIRLARLNSTTENIAFADFISEGITADPANGSILATTNTSVTITHTESGETAIQAITVNAVPVTVTGISINAAPSKVTYTEGDALDLNGLVITLTRSNSTTEDVAFADFISEGITADPANGSILATTNTFVTITHTESGETAIQAITVNAVPVTVTDVSINAAPSKVTYTEGDALDLNGLVITLTRSNSTTEDVAFADFISEGITADPANGSILATTNTSVTITHTESGETAIQAITVNAVPVTVTGISINTSPSKVTYTEGDALDLNGLVIRLARSNSTTEDVAFADFISEGITADPANGSILATTNTSVTITHTESGETAIQAITVNAVPVTVTGISINAAPSKVTYTEGDALDLNGLVIRLARSNSTTEDVAFADFISEGITADPANGSILATTNTSVTITHTESGETAIQTITVNAAPVTVSSINVTAAGSATTVENGKTLQMTAAVLPTNAIDKTVIWSVINGTGTATITQTGLLTGTAVGTVTVKATSKDGSNIAGIYNITVSEAQSTTTPTTGGGGGGGGGQSTGEKYENIELKDYSIKYVLRDTETVFEFTKEGNSIVGIGFTARLNGGQTKTVIEMLKSTSTMVNKAAPGNVYKNVNIWVGDGKTTPDLLSDARIMFKVEKVWIAGNGIDPASIRMLRYNSGSWAQLPTSRTGEDDVYVYYIAQTPGFSAFAISSISKEEQQAVSGSNQQGSPSQSGESAQMSTEDSQTPQAGNVFSPEAKSSGSSTFLLVLAGISALGVLSYKYKDQLSQVRTQLGNPDGKRYRRVKR